MKQIRKEYPEKNDAYKELFSTFPVTDQNALHIKNIAFVIDISIEKRYL